MPAMTYHTLYRKFYDLPAVVRADRETEIVIRPLFQHNHFQSDVSYTVRHVPFEQLPNGDSGQEISPSLKEGCLSFSLHFAGEAEHNILLDIVRNGARKNIAQFRIYSLRDDLYNRLPFKGDIHMHSCRSDGREEPGYVAGVCRRSGLDFMALTDHNYYGSSFEAVEAFNGLPVDLRIFPGEEIHPPENPVHMLNFGGSSSVADLFQKDPDGYKEAVREIQDNLETLPAGVDPYQYASCLWCFENIRKAGGLAVFCHPYWYSLHHFMAPGPVTDLLFEKKPFDALEVISALNFHHTRENLLENTMHTARYYDECVNHGWMPIVGVSDAHRTEGADEFGRCFTLVFSPTLELSDIIENIKACYSVAVEDLPGLGLRPHGPFRLVKYAHFLLREVFPLHDALCVEEGRLMIEHLAGDREAGKRLSSLSGRTAALLDKLKA